MTTTYISEYGKEIKIRTQSDEDLGTLVSIYENGKMINNFMITDSEKDYHTAIRLTHNFIAEESTEIETE